MTTPTTNPPHMPVQARRKAAEALYESAAEICDPAAESRPRNWKSRAKRLLEASTALTTRLPKANALLAYLQYLQGDVTAAEASLRRALRLDADNGVNIRFLMTLLLAQGKRTAASRWLRKLADLEGVDLSNVKAALRQARLPTDTSTVVLNVFPNGVVWFESRLSDEVEQVQRRRQANPEVDAKLEQEMDRLRQQKIDARKVPRDLRSLIPIAREWGIGDDAARGAFIRRASKHRTRQLRKALPAKVRRRINDWLDQLGDAAAMTDEATCFLYLLLAYEELTD